MIIQPFSNKHYDCRHNTIQMKISNQTKSILWLVILFILFSITLHLYVHYQVDQQWSKKQAVAEIAIQVSSFLLPQNGVEGNGSYSDLRIWRQRFDDLQQRIAEHPDLQQATRDDLSELELVAKDIDQWSTTLRDGETDAIKQGLITRMYLPSRNLLSTTHAFSRQLNTRMQRRVRWLGMFETGLFLASLIVGTLLLYRLLSQISQSLKGLNLEIKGVDLKNDLDTKARTGSRIQKPFHEIEEIAKTFNNLLIQLNQYKEDLLESKQLLEGIFNAANVGLCQVDSNARFVRVNEEYCRIYGYPPEELIGEKITKILPEGTHQQALTTYQKLMENPPDKQEHPYEWQVVNKKGEVLDIFTTTAIVDSKESRYQIASILDISKYKDDQRKLSVAVESGEIGTWFLDLRDGTLTINKYWASMLGYSTDEIAPVQSSFLQLVHPDDKRFVDDAMQRIGDPGYTNFNFRIRLRCKDGSYKWILDSGMVTRRGKNGEPLVMAGTHIDLNEEIEWRSKIEKERDRLRESQRLGRLGDWTYDLATGEITSSEQVYDIFEWDKTQPPPSFDTLLEYNTKQGAQTLKQSVDRAIAHATPYDIKHTILVDGQKKHIRSIGKPILDNQGKVTALKGVTQDITKQVNAEQDKQLFLNRLNAIADNIPGTIFQYKLNDDGTDQLLFVSKGAQSLWNYTPNQIMANNQLVWDQLHEDDLPDVMASISASASTMSQWKAEWRNVNRDGSISWHQGSGSPRRYDDAIIWDSIIMDVTDRKMAELKSQERQAYLRSLYENAFDGILSCDEEGRLVYFNKKLQEWVGDLSRDIDKREYPRAFGLYTFDQSRLLKPEELSLHKALKHGITKNNRFTIINDLHDHVRFVEANGTRIVNEKGEIKGAIVLIRDITEVIQADAAVSNAVLDAIDEERAKIASELHDNIIQKLGMSRMHFRNLVLERPDVGDTEKYQKIEQLLTRSVEDIRNLSHTIIPVSIKDFGLVLSIQEMLEELPLAQQINIHFSWNQDVRVDSILEINLFRIFQEAISNVERHAQATDVWITLLFTKQEVKLTIEDNGIGIDPHYSQRKERKGIGLVTMKNRIERAGGHFHLDSSASGTTLVFKAPISQRQA
jgi:PAS domain S-box-containing protein